MSEAFPRVDYHLHSAFSSDSVAPIDVLCEAAIAQGIGEISLTEHVDFSPEDEGIGYYQPDPYLAEVERCRDKFAGRLVIKAGVELGDVHLFPAESTAALVGRDYDFALGAVHWVEHRAAFGRDYFPTAAQPAEVGAGWVTYLAAVREAVELGVFSVLAHFDLPKRWAGSPFVPEEHVDQIRDIIQRLIERGIGLEINTSGLRAAAGETLPGLSILRWYRELGGELLTIGSDGHRPSEVGAGFAQARALAEAAGFSRLTRYSHLRPE